VRKLLALVVVAVLAAGCGGGGGTSGRAASDRLPDVTLPSLTGGRPVDLGALRGPAVVNLWAQWCAPCRRELPIYESFYRAHHDKVAVLGVDWQDTLADRARQLAGDSGVTYPLVADTEPKIRANLLPRLILVDGSGKIAFEEYVEITSLSQLERLVEKHLGVAL
jgi:thiol-disulfide isomerase/thioredoxin